MGNIEEKKVYHLIKVYIQNKSKNKKKKNFTIHTNVLQVNKI